MKVVLLAGGFGSRITEESQYRPKPDDTGTVLLSPASNPLERQVNASPVPLNTQASGMAWVLVATRRRFFKH